MNTTKARIFLLSVFVTFGEQAPAQQPAELIRNACTPQEYKMYVQAFTRSLQVLVDAPPKVIPLGDLLSEGFRKVSPQCNHALEAIALPGSWRACTPQQKQKMIASNNASEWPQPLRADCWNF